MIYPAITSAYAAVFALVFVGLSGWVAASRAGENKLHGDGGDPAFAKRIRTHGNFAEYVPFALLLVAFFEAQGRTSATMLHGLLIVLLVARLAHPFGMFAPKNSPRQFACRGGGIFGTLAVLSVTAILLLLRSG